MNLYTHLDLCTHVISENVCCSLIEGHEAINLDHMSLVEIRRYVRAYHTWSRRTVAHDFMNVVFRCSTWLDVPLP